MIKFFRNIRIKLASENKAMAYSRYAIGEIILVVIGILIALQINNWNENRIKSNKETAILADIHEEFIKNKQQLDSVVNRHEDAFINCRKIIQLFPIKSKPEPPVLDSLSHYLFWSYGGVTFNPSQSSIDALTSTSSFDIISNQELKKLLISWNDLMKDYQEEERYSREYVWEQYDPYMSKHFDWSFDFNDQRNHFDALQTLEFEFKIKNRYDLLDQILNTSGELQKLQGSLEQIIKLSQPNSGN